MIYFKVIDNYFPIYKVEFPIHIRHNMEVIFSRMIIDNTYILDGKLTFI